MSQLKFSVLALALVLVATMGPAANAGETILAVVRNVTRVKIIESNNVSLRPGSVYENTTIFESLLGWDRPGFNYEFIDSGLGAADPLYPLYQKGYQWSWEQVLPAFVDPNSRHIDHLTSLVTPEGCKVDGLYGLRHISEYPATQFQKERAEGYEQIVIRLEMYTRLFPTAQCGRHFSREPDPNFDPQEFLIRYHNFMNFSEIPAADLARFEWKTSAIHHFEEELNRNKWPRFDLEKMNHNSLWFYPDGQTLDFGLNQPHALPGLTAFNLPRHALVQATPEMQKALPLARFLDDTEFTQLLAFFNARPVPSFDANQEPGGDALNLRDVTPANIYTSGLYIEKIKDVVSDVSDRSHYGLVAMTIRPFEPQEEAHEDQGKLVPQIRLVYQLMDPRHPGRAFEQLFLHLKYDVVDRNADLSTRLAQHTHFLSRVDELTRSSEARTTDYPAKLEAFINEFTRRPMRGLAFSSSLTGLWIFGSLYRPDEGGPLRALRIIRDGIDVGYYSSTYDNDLFRGEIASTFDVDRQALLKQHMDDLMVLTYRDPRRFDTAALTFNRVTCSQCHQTAGRDGVHVSFNDQIDRRYVELVKPSEYFIREADRQLKVGETYFGSSSGH